ncbi:MAG: VOC family protein [Anaerolineales bacterium]|nr:VOC family protein [Anaerolineales bacterium]MCB9143909.1 VOC family protein [Anaerolineales bacterium]
MSNRNIVHVEIPAVDVDSSSRFYADLFGWKINHMSEMNYTMWEAGDGSGGGITAISEDNPAEKLLVYIASDDIDADLEKVLELGGKVLREKTEIPGMGWFGIFQDPNGNALALYTNLNP